jgi:1-acyl-sn-glycerol-3-phosphate acyltransferase
MMLETLDLKRSHFEITGVRQVFKVLGFAANLLEQYFRVELHGLKHLPSEKPLIFAPNHSGFSGRDVLILAHLLSKQRGQMPRIIAHRAYFELGKAEARISRAFGLRPACRDSLFKSLARGHDLLIFPEGEDGNFKPSTEAYKLQPFHTGFLHGALQDGAPIVRTIVIGAEETHFNAAKIDLSAIIPRFKAPLPLNLLPLPAKWDIHFMQALRYPATNQTLPVDLRGEAERIRATMQAKLNRELARRPYIYFPKVL